MKAILGKKIGMTQIFTETGEAVPVTVIKPDLMWLHKSRPWRRMDIMRSDRL